MCDTRVLGELCAKCSQGVVTFPTSLAWKNPYSTEIHKNLWKLCVWSSDIRIFYRNFLIVNPSVVWPSSAEVQGKSTKIPRKSPRISCLSPTQKIASLRGCCTFPPLNTNTPPMHHHHDQYQKNRWGPVRPPSVARWAVVKQKPIFPSLHKCIKGAHPAVSIRAANEEELVRRTAAPYSRVVKRG